MFLALFTGDVEVFFLLDLTEQEAPFETDFVCIEATKTALPDSPLESEVCTADKHIAMIEAIK